MTQALIEWIDGQPFSPLFGDIYFSRDSGLDESRHVFLHGNDLPARWQSLAAGSVFVIGETGFGTGLNFLVAWQRWVQAAPRGRLHFVSFELHPLTAEQLGTAHQTWPELALLSQALRDQYVDPGEGWHRYSFQGGDVVLTLIIGDARSCLPRLVGKVHAWFLDGFAPARNPQLWGPDVARELASHSHPGATLASFTSAGAVRRTLQAAGFFIRKQRGHGRKREMIVGQLEAQEVNRAQIAPLEDAQATSGREVIVIGAGIAGSATASALAARGWRVTVLDQAPRRAAGASGIAQATMNLRLPRHLQSAHRIALTGYQHSIRLWRQHRVPDLPCWHPCGTLQLDHASRRVVDDAALDRMGLPPNMARRVTRDEASHIAGIRTESGGLHFPMGGWINGEAICGALTNHALITPVFAAQVDRIESTADNSGWGVHIADGRKFSARAVVLSNAIAAQALLPPGRLPLHAVRGQISLICETPSSRHLRTVLCGEGVVTPVHHQLHSVGATYRHNQIGSQPTTAEHEENRLMLQSLSPALFETLPSTQWAAAGAFVAYRTTTPDRTPIAGAWTDASCDGLFLNIAHGSRGFSTAPLLGEHVASLMAGEPSPLPKELAAAVSPARFAA